jgi:hypothetical protein
MHCKERVREENTCTVGKEIKLKQKLNVVVSLTAVSRYC